MKHPSFSRGGRRGMHEQRIGGDFFPVSLKKAWQLGCGLADLYWSLRYSSLFKLNSSKSLAISSVTKAIERNRKQLQSFVFRDHKQEHKRKEMFHHCYMFAIIYDSSSTSWELRNSVLPMLFQSGNVKDVCTSTSTIQGCFFFYWMAFNSNMSIAPVVYIRELRNSVLPILFHDWKCERRALTVLPQFKDAFFCWVAFNSNTYIINIHMETIIFPMKDHMGHETILGKYETIIISWIWPKALHTYWVL